MATRISETKQHADPEEASQRLTPQGASARDELVREAVSLVLGAGGVPYCDLHGQMLLRRPKQEGTRRTMMEFPVKSERTAAWMARLMFDKHLPALGRKEQTQAIFILEGIAIDNEVPIEVPDLMDRDVVFQALAALMRENPDGWSGTATELLLDLCEVAERNKITLQYDPRWPRDGSHLTLHVRKLLPWLAEIGVAYDFYRRGNYRKHRFRLVEVTAPESRPTVGAHTSVQCSETCARGAQLCFAPRHPSI